MKITQNFQGTSKEEDFQSALLEATNKALESLSIINNVAISDQRIEWKIIKYQVVKADL